MIRAWARSGWAHPASLIVVDLPASMSPSLTVRQLNCWILLTIQAGLFKN